jgi:hypothetical protein
LLEQTYDMSLTELVQHLNDIDGLDAIIQFFTSNAYTVNRYIPGVVGIKYIDGMNQIWQPKWSREARGRYFWIGHKKGTHVVELKSALQRGIEVLTKAHTDVGINETQDVDPKSWDKFDKVQRQILKAFSGSNPIDAFLTMKVDGSLAIVNVYPKSSEQYSIIKELALTHGDEFTQTIVNYCIKNDLPLVTVATQGTLFIGPDMQDYFVTAIQPLIAQQIKSMDDWTWVVPQFVNIMLEYYKCVNLDEKSMVNFCFEAYCKDRTTITGKVHTELAVGYDRSGFNLLGMMYQGKYTPHPVMPRKIFMQPAFFNVSNTDEVIGLLKELDEVVLGVRTMEQFMSNFVLDEFTSRDIHAEGFVILTQLGNGEIDYAKIKAALYYKCHKVRQDNVQSLLKMPASCSQYYPIIKQMHDFFDNLSTTINQLVEETCQVLTKQIDTGSVLYQLQNKKAQDRMDAVIKSPDPKLSGPVYKMMLNTKGSDKEIVRLFGPVTVRLYKTESEQMMIYVKNLLMKIEPWFPDWNKRLDNLFTTFDDTLNELFGIVVGFSI